jgi:hypothetical protein
MKFFFKFIFISVNSEIKLVKKNESQQIYPFFSTVVAVSLLTYAGHTLLLHDTRDPITITTAIKARTTFFIVSRC